MHHCALVLVFTKWIQKFTGRLSAAVEAAGGDDQLKLQNWKSAAQVLTHHPSVSICQRGFAKKDICHPSNEQSVRQALTETTIKSWDTFFLFGAGFIYDIFWIPVLSWGAHIMDLIINACLYWKIGKQWYWLQEKYVEEVFFVLKKWLVRTNSSLTLSLIKPELKPHSKIHKIKKVGETSMYVVPFTPNTP